MSRRSSRRGAARNTSASASLPPNTEQGLASLVEGNEDMVASMLSIDRPPERAPLVAALSDYDCMRLNRLSAEALLARFFPTVVLARYCTDVLGASGKGNEATLAARTGKKWSSGPDFETTRALRDDNDDKNDGGTSTRSSEPASNEDDNKVTSKSSSAGSSFNNNNNNNNNSNNNTSITSISYSKTKKTKKRAPSTTSEDTECVVKKTKPKTNDHGKNSTNSNKKSRTTASGQK